MSDRGELLPTVIFLSVHKAASTFLAADLAPALCRALPGLRHLRIGWHHIRGTPLEELALPPRGVIATRVYPNVYDALIEDPPPPGGRFAGKRLVMVRRDPRDAAVSLHYSRAYSHRVPPGREEHFLAERQRLQSIPVAEGIRELTAAEAIAEFRGTVDFLARHPHTCDAPYELLTGDFDAWWARVAAHAQWPDDVTASLRPALAPCVQPPAEEDPQQHKRRVTPGNWREVFDDDLCRLFEHEIGKEMAGAGYT